MQWSMSARTYQVAVFMIQILVKSGARIVNMGGFALFAFCTALDAFRLGVDWIDWFFSVAL